SDLVLRNLSDGSERTLNDVTEYSLANDGKLLVYAVGSKDNTKNGMFAVKPGDSAAPVALAEGKGKYVAVAWDENQTQLAFLSARHDPAAKPPKSPLSHWTRQSPKATLLASTATPGFRKEYVIAERGSMTFSKDGTRIMFPCAPPAAPRNTPAADA